RILALVVRGRVGRPQGIEAVLLGTRGGGGESGQLEDHPGAGIQFRQRQIHGRSFGGHVDLGTGTDVGRGQFVLLAVAAQDHRRLSSAATSAEGTAAEATATAATATRRAAGTGRRAATAGDRARTCGPAALRSRPRRSGARAGACATRAAEATAAAGTAAAAASGGADAQPPDIALANDGVPGGLEVTG